MPRAPRHSGCELRSCSSRFLKLGCRLLGLLASMWLTSMLGTPQLHGNFLKSESFSTCSCLPQRPCLGLTYSILEWMAGRSVRLASELSACGFICSKYKPRYCPTPPVVVVLFVFSTGTGRRNSQETQGNKQPVLPFVIGQDFRSEMQTERTLGAGSRIPLFLSTWPRS